MAKERYFSFSLVFFFVSIFMQHFLSREDQHKNKIPFAKQKNKIKYFYFTFLKIISHPAFPTTELSLCKNKSISPYLFYSCVDDQTSPISLSKMEFLIIGTKWNF